MYHKCTWCKARILSKPIYYTQGFMQLSPGFGVYCNAVCSLSAHTANQNQKVSAQIPLPEPDPVNSSQIL